MCIFCERAQAQLADGLTPSQKREAEKCESLRERRVRATILTGFLGAGKTTFLNFVLKSLGHGKKIGVVQNEFGSVSIDDDLMPVERSDTETVVMPNGCLCCRVRGDLVDALRRLAERSATSGGVIEEGTVQLDNLIIECSGLSEVLPVAQTFFADPFVQAAFQLDGVICVCDAANFEAMEGGAADIPANESSGGSSSTTAGVAGEEVSRLLREQLAVSDICLLNKCDMVDAAKRDRISSRIRSICPSIKVVPCRHGKVNLGQVLKVSSFSLETALSLDAFFLQGVDGVADADSSSSFCAPFGGGTSKAKPLPEGVPGSAPSHAHTVFGSIGLDVDDDIDIDALKVWLMKVVETHGDRLLRLKGVLRPRSAPTEDDQSRRRAIVQGVGGHIEIGEEAGPAPAGSAKSSRLVFIGRLDSELKAELKAGFLSTTATAVAEAAAVAKT